MSQEPRKATEVLVDLESKIDVLLDVVRAQDFNIKILSNKLNSVMEQLQKTQAAPPKITVEAIQTPIGITPVTNPVQPPVTNPFVQMPVADPDKSIPVAAEAKLPQDSSPQGFRRNSRPETYAGDNAYLPHAEEGHRMPMQIPKPPPGRTGNDVVVPQPTKQKPPQQPQKQAEQTQSQPTVRGNIPVIQRIVDRNNKSVFLADVEVTDLTTSQPVFKTRTNGTGKWMASLGIGAYRVVVRKRESVTKERVEAVQDIQVDGTQSPLELPVMIIK